MSTADASDYAKADEYIQYKLQKARRRIKFADLLTAGLLAAVLLIGYVLIFTVLDHWVVSGGFGNWTRAIGLAVVLLLCTGIVVRYVLVPWFKTIHPLYAARVLDGSGSGLKGALVSLVDLNAGQDQVSESVRSVMEKRAAVTLSEVNVDDAIDQRWLLKLGIALFVLVVLTSLYAVFSPKGINLIRPLTVAESAVATETRILKVDPGSTTIAAGETLEVSVDLGGEIPAEVTLEFTTTDKTYVDEVLTLSTTDSETQFTTIILGDADRGLRQNFTYRVVAGDAVSEDFQVTVDQPPTANVVEANYEYPEYMMLPAQETADGNLVAWEGTKVQLIAEASVPVKRATLQFSDTATFDVPAEEISLRTQETKILGEFTLGLRQDRSSPKFYRIDVEDYEGRVDPQPTVYAVNIREDKAPIVKLLDPIRDLQVPSNAIIPMLVQAEDPDFMLRSVKLAFDINGDIQTPAILYDGTRTALQQKWTGTYDFRLEDLGLKPGDVVNYYATARDNKPPLGSMSPSSNLKLMITEPQSKEQIQERLEQDRQMQKQQFQEQQKESAEQGEAQDEQASDQEQSGGDGQKGASGSESAESSEGSQRGKGGERGNNANQNSEQQPDSQPGDGPSQESGGPEEGSQTESSKNSTGDEQSGNEQGGDKNQEGTESRNGENTKRENGEVGAPSDSRPGADQNGERSDNATGPSSPTNSGQPADQLNPDTGTGDDSESRPVDDSEAMQKLLEKYRNENGGIDPPEQTMDPDSEQNEGNPGNPSNTNDSQNSESPTDSSNPSGEGSQESATPTENSDPRNRESGNGTEGQQTEQTGDPKSADGSTESSESTTENPPGGEQTQKPGKGQMQQEGTPQENQGSDQTNADQNDVSNTSNEQQPANQQNSNGDSQNQSDSGKQSAQQNQDSNSEQNSSAENGQQNQDGESQSGEQGEGSNGQNGKQDGGSKSGGQDGKQDGGSKSGGQDGKQGGGSKSGGQDGKQGGGSKSGGQDGKQGGGSKSGGQDGKQGGGSKSGGQDGKQGGGSKSGGQDGKQGGGSKSGGQDGKQGGGSKSGGQDGKQGGGSKSGGQDGKQGGGSKSGGQDGKQGDKNSGGSKSGKHGGEQQGGSKSGDQKGGNSKSGQQSGQGQQQGGDQPGAQGGGGGTGQSAAGNTGGRSGSSDGPMRNGGNGDGGSGDFQTDDPDVKSSAEAADLVLRRLKQDLERGEVDQDLLKELGWTEDQLKQLHSRMSKKLDTLKSADDPSSKAEQLRRRRAEELLKSLDLKGPKTEKLGTNVRDVEQQDTTSRRVKPPASYRDWMEMYQRGLSKGKK